MFLYLRRTKEQQAILSDVGFEADGLGHSWEDLERAFLSLLSLSLRAARESSCRERAF